MRKPFKKKKVSKEKSWFSKRWERFEETRVWQSVVRFFCVNDGDIEEYGDKAEPYPMTVVLFYAELALMLWLLILIVLPGGLYIWIVWPFTFALTWATVLRVARKRTSYMMNPIMFDPGAALFGLVTIGNLIYGFVSYWIARGVLYAAELVSVTSLIQ